MNSTSANCEVIYKHMTLVYNTVRLAARDARPAEVIALWEAMDTAAIAFMMRLRSISGFTRANMHVRKAEKLQEKCRRFRDLHRKD